MKQEDHEEILKSVRDQLAIKDQFMAQKEESYHEELARLRGLLREQGSSERTEAERNALHQQLVELQQETDRLRSVLKETLAGVQHWVPDLTPIGDPPPTVPREQHATWVATEVARRRQDWDTFVGRVVTQGTV